MRRGDGPLISKRIVDLGLGWVLLVLVTPIIAVCAAASAFALGANPFFVQDRIGRGGRRFRFVKLRTLPPETPAYADKYAIRSVEPPAICRWLRRLHLDELPQLALVALGRMSLVGPRPEMPGLHDEMDETHAHLRTSVRPGCTGLWQVSEGVSGLILESPQYDLYYVRNRSLRLDAWILWRTGRHMVGLGRAIELDDVPRWVRRNEPLAGPARRPVSFREAVLALITGMK